MGFETIYFPSYLSSHRDGKRIYLLLDTYPIWRANPKYPIYSSFGHFPCLAKTQATQSILDFENKDISILELNQRNLWRNLKALVSK